MNSEEAKYGKIDLILGPMFAGKTSELIRRLKRYEIAEKPILLIKYFEDTRYNSGNGELLTHNKTSYEAVSASNLLGEEFQIREKNRIEKADVIGIDEGQFFKDLPQFSQEMVKAGKIVIISALSGTYQQKPWPVISTMIPYADEISFLQAVCTNCKIRDAAFSMRISDEKDVKIIGGKGKYEPRCGLCYNEKNGQLEV